MTALVVPGDVTTQEIAGGVVSVAGGGLIVTVAVAYLVVFATLVARIVTICCEVTLAGAVYKPVGEIKPSDGLRLQLTRVFVVPVTEAINCLV
jgi:hypothetical protein